MATPTTPSPILHDHRFIRLTTFRTTGAAVPTTVTFAEDNGKLYVVTGGNTGKLKRLQHNPAVEVVPCDRRGTVVGPALQGHARILSAPAGRALRSQVTFRAPALIMLVFNLLRALRSGGNVYLEISLD